MTGARIVVSKFGPYVSEGSRLLWVAVRRKGLTLDALRVELGVGAGMLGRWLRGEQRPGGKGRAILHARFRIGPSTWDVPPSKAFSLEKTENAA
jgi:transcriptional regulator with XRE-family HTH domain